MDRPGNCAAGCCTNTLVPQLPIAGPSARPDGEELVHPSGDEARLVAQHPHPSDRHPRLSASRQGDHQLQGHASARRFRPGRPVFKDPYLFDFLGTADPRREREVEQALVDHIQRFLLELGSGFAFVGRQVHLEFASHDYYLDLLFYHLKLRCYVVIELKAVSFEPGFAGQMNMYLSAVDDLLRHADDKPTIGLLLCRVRDRFIVEYALRDMRKPIGVAEWEPKLVETLPEDLTGSLPTVEEIEAALAKPAERRR